MHRLPGGAICIAQPASLILPRALPPGADLKAPPSRQFHEPRRRSFILSELMATVAPSPHEHTHSVDHGDFSLLPPNARMVLAAIGPEATWRLIEARGGTRIYVPMIGEPIEQSPLFTILGADALTALVKAFSGDQFILPRCVRYMRARRDAEICRRHQAGEPIWTLAVEFKLSEATVWAICAEVRLPKRMLQHEP